VRPGGGSGSALRSHRPRKRFGQHFLADAWAQKVVKAIAVEPGDVFLEIGPGKGALTFPLAASGAPVLAVEIDRDLVRDLASRLPPNVTVVSADVLKTDVVQYLSGLEPQRAPDHRDSGRPARRTRIVGNLPYNLTTPILFHLAALQAQHRMFTDATLMVQKEVADRLAARPGTRDYGVLTVMMAVHGRIRRLLDLPPGAFRPAPKVHSSVIQLTFAPPSVKISDHRRLEQVAKALFSQRRKMIANSLKSITRDPLPFLKATGIDPKRRPETLTLKELAALTELLHRPAGAPVLGIEPFADPRIR
jgi:16S rRNA (adenine1518-N6/adenine1519-N6)-dimethyltransferase